MKNFSNILVIILSAFSLQAQMSEANLSFTLASVSDENYASQFEYHKPNTCHPTDFTFTISGIYTQDKIETIKTNIRSLLNESTDLTTLSTLSINIESSGKIAVIPQGKIDENIIDNIREYLSTYDWDYLHEIMTVDILIVFNRPH